MSFPERFRGAKLVGVLIGLAGAYLIVQVGFARENQKGHKLKEISSARLEADTIKKQGELAAKEEVLKRRAYLRGRDRRARGNFREQERRSRQASRLSSTSAELINIKEVEPQVIGSARLADQQEGGAEGTPRSSKTLVVSSKTCSASAACRGDGGRRRCCSAGIADELSTRSAAWS